MISDFFIAVALLIIVFSGAWYVFKQNRQKNKQDILLLFLHAIFGVAFMFAIFSHWPAYIGLVIGLVYGVLYRYYPPAKKVK